MNIYVNMCDYYGAPAPEFDPKCVNETEFLHEEWCKYADIEFNPDDESYVNWLTQESETQSAEWEDEIKRAFKANGAKPGHVIHCKYGIRDYGFQRFFDLIID